MIGGVRGLAGKDLTDRADGCNDGHLHPRGLQEAVQLLHYRQKLVVDDQRGMACSCRGEGGVVLIAQQSALTTEDDKGEGDMDSAVRQIAIWTVADLLAAGAHVVEQLRLSKAADVAPQVGAVVQHIG